MGIEGKIDGCALFFKSSRFNLVEKYVIEFNEAAAAGLLHSESHKRFNNQVRTFEKGKEERKGGKMKGDRGQAKKKK